MAIIEIQLNSLPQLFDSLDPAPFHDRALDREAEAWLRESVDEVPSREPLELVVRARHEALAAQQMRVLLEEVAVRLRPGLGQVLLASCGLTVLVVLGFGHGLQLAQAIALLLVPLAAVRLMNLRAARRVAAILPGETEPVVRMLLAHHTLVQFFGFAMIGATALYGMLRVLRAHYLGS